MTEPVVRCLCGKKMKKPEPKETKPTIGQLCKCRHIRRRHIEGKCMSCNCNKFELITNWKKPEQKKITKKEILLFEKICKAEGFKQGQLEERKKWMAGKGALELGREMERKRVLEMLWDTLRNKTELPPEEINYVLEELEKQINSEGKE